MKIREIKKIITEMDTDLKGGYSLLKGKFDFYAEEGNVESGFEMCVKMRDIEKKRTALQSIDIDNMDLRELIEIEKYLVKLGKDSWFSKREVCDFIEFYFRLKYSL